MTTRSTVLGELKRGASIIVTKVNDAEGDRYSTHPYGTSVSPRCFNSLRCVLKAGAPGLIADTPQTWVLDPGKLPSKWRLP